MQTFLKMLTDPNSYRRKRDESMMAARGCREALTNPEGYWKLSPDDEKVKEGVGYWVARARQAHNVAMGRTPVIPKATFINNGESTSGSLYAGRA